MTIPGRNQYRCNGNECNHLHEVKKIYLREVAVGTDSDFPMDKSRSSIVEKSRRTTFDSDADPYSNGYRRANGNESAALITSANTNRHNHNYNKASLSRSNNYSNSRSVITNREIKSYAQEDRMQGMINDREKLMNNIQRECQPSHVDSDGNEYTPVPVKQLIQEFEKTCRPVLQYKQFSPKVIPIIQHSPLDNDIARFFETRNNQVKYNLQEEQRR